MAPKKNALAAMMKQSREVSKSPEAKKRRVEVPQPGGVKEVLEVFKDGLEGTYEEQQKKLYEAAAALMTHFELDINGSMWRLAELEAYVYHDTHPDAYTHRNDDQLELCSWYFHRQGNGSYKGGTYKGMDLTFGCRENKLYGGFLVRSIQEVRTNAVVEGPCLVVNKILELNQVGSIADFAAGRNGAQLNVEETEGLLRPTGRSHTEKRLRQSQVLREGVPFLYDRRFHQKIQGRVRCGGCQRGDDHCGDHGCV
eukprot:TRINITY_DN8223_c0_g1_i3.p1 TRINITY_DN8223_c0_g1~~TRINITY_DN8223_c0_g1_i3.p1  ORF type:complete len:254 (+),score=45.70 TRINITY_DN8223_c0_g1_i3:38-799(+)